MAELDPPSERQCLLCGRRDVWSDDDRNWQIRSEDESGEPFCIHEWDINGAYRPIRD
ncbi:MULTISPECIES: HEWD family protein [Halorussus]|uniref:HEWD family protein n=1 Tax=Halorussus TaxID=1070314 RepID=UPI001404C0C9|nr:MULTISPECIES: HEWD family protein [Halorussus]NHN58850.1 hypothetical protein [Halorussus sp. JP-T4]